MMYILRIRHIGPLYWHGHMQDLTKDKGGRGINKRAWLHLYWGDPDRRGRKLTCLCAQWVLFRRQHSIGADLTLGSGDSDRDIDLSIRVPYVGIYLSAEDVWPRRWEFYNPKQKHPSSRKLGFSWHDSILWLNLFADPDGWHSGVSWRDARSRYRQPALHVVDWLLGKVQHTARTLRAEPATISMPEGDYPISITFKLETWRRPRALRGRTITRAHVELQRPIPIPGKGESSWDCDDDAIYSSTFPAATVDDVIAHMRASVFQRREREG